MTPGIGTDRTWALWGNTSRVAASMSHLDFYGSNTPSAIAGYMGDGVQGLLVSMAISDMLDTMSEKYAAIRDKARTHHGHFRAEVIRDLRNQLLTLSMDLATARRDLDVYWSMLPDFQGEYEFTVEFNPGVPSDHSPIHMNRTLRDGQAIAFSELVAADAEYRDILSTVASLGASLDASRTGRRALWVAFASLVVAILTVVVSGSGDQGAVLDGLADWVATLGRGS